MRVDIQAILRNPRLKRKLMARVIVATQAREGIVTTLSQAYVAYDRVQTELEKDRA